MVTYFLFIVLVLSFLGLYFGTKIGRTCALSLISLLIALFPLALLLGDYSDSLGTKHFE